MINFDEFEFGTKLHPQIEEFSGINLGKINRNTLRKNTKSKYVIYKLSSDKLDNCIIWDETNSKIMVRALKYSILNNCEIIIDTATNFRKKYPKSNHIFLSSQGLSGLEINGSRVISNYFVILINDKIFI